MSDNSQTSTQDLRDAVRENYARVALEQPGEHPDEQTDGSCGCCSGEAPTADAGSAYSPSELAQMPDGLDMGLGCGNPTGIAGLSEGDVVLDLGSGGGIDVFLAGQRIGASGRAIGVDMTPEMISRARNNTGSYSELTGFDNVEFRLGEIEHLPVADASVDVVLSNCVINLSTDKASVWKEIGRVLRPGGRVAIADIALLRELPPSIAERIDAYTGRVAGAVRTEETTRMALDANLSDVSVTATTTYDAEDVAEWSDQALASIADDLCRAGDTSHYIASVLITARKAA